MSTGAFRNELPPVSPAILRRKTAFALALALPLICSFVTAHSAVLGSIPFSLYYLSIAAIGIVGGIWPALLACLMCMLTRNLIVLPPYGLLTYQPGDFVRVPTLVADALLVTGLDMRRRRSAERLEVAMDVLQERTDALVESFQASKCASWTIDLESGKSARWFRGSYQVFGRSYDEIEGMPSLGSLLHADDQGRFPALVLSMKTGHEPVVFDYRTIWPNGEIHWLEMRAHRVQGDGCVWRGLTVDITERKLAESILLRQEKLAAMGRLASTVAHEINNPLEAVTNLLYLTRQDETLSPETQNYLNTAEKELARLGDITRLTLGFVRNTSLRRALSLESVVDEVFSIFRHRYDMKGIDLQRSSDPCVEVHMAPHELRQILTNLVSNAADALNVKQPRVCVSIRREGEHAVFVLEDNGTGISEDALPRIFEPFFTTKSDVGTGIGLWVTRELVEANGGRISVESGKLERGMRTRFRVELPLAVESLEPAAATTVEVSA